MTMACSNPLCQHEAVPDPRFMHPSLLKMNYSLLHYPQDIRPLQL
jgi:hypothetical protein